jgi:hypothetical protein
MADPFDIFEIESKDAVRWLGATATLAEAQATIGRYGSGAASAASSKRYKRPR